MLISESGFHQTSERYFFTPSSFARDLFYYPIRCGHYFCDSRYSFSHRSEIAMEGDHNRNIMLFVIRSGAMELELSGMPVLAAAGQVVLFDCRQPYKYTASDGLEFIWPLFNGLNIRVFYRRILQAHGGRQCFTIRCGHPACTNTPHAARWLRRIDKAKYLLTSTKQSVGEIAYATDYNSEENFSHSFLKHVGISPDLFRKYPV